MLQAREDLVENSSNCVYEVSSQASRSGPSLRGISAQFLCWTLGDSSVTRPEKSREGNPPGNPKQGYPTVHPTEGDDMSRSASVVLDYVYKHAYP